MQKKEWIGMILAGGQGSRLGILTRRVAKPAVPFGGKYRIIDFPLSNCHNSGIDTVGILTQYRPMALHSYIGTGTAWDLDRKNGGVYTLPPFAKEQGGEWYRGTADAIYQNHEFIDMYDPDYVVILSGDHIYKMDYSLMLDVHKRSNADATIAVMEVPWEEANRFGIMATNEEDRIVEFAEKPKQPKSNLASMGVYIFSWPVLRRYLFEDAPLDTDHDFGKNIIPNMLDAKQRLFAYRFKGYWKDVGTIDSLWEANMDLLADVPNFNLYDPNWKVYSVNPTRPPHYVGERGQVIRSLVNEGCQIFGQVENSVLFPGVYIGPGAKVKDSVIMSNVHIGAGVNIDRSIVARKASIGENSVVGLESDDQPMAEPSGIVVIGETAIVPSGSNIKKGAVVSNLE